MVCAIMSILHSIQEGPMTQEGAAPTPDLLTALNDAGLHMVQSRLKLASDLAGCGSPVAALEVCTNWTGARMNEFMADQARVMEAFLALAAPAAQDRGPNGR
jgi:hypothetical protein